MREMKINSKLIIVLGLVMVIFFSCSWLIQEWGVWSISTMDQIILGFITMLLGMITKISSYNSD